MRPAVKSLPGERMSRPWRSGITSWPFGPGAYAEYFTAPAMAVMKLDPSIPWKRAAVIEPLAGSGLRHRSAEG